jgi:hypothetical protein
VEKALVDMIAGCLKALERTIADMLIVLICGPQNPVDFRQQNEHSDRNSDFYEVFFEKNPPTMVGLEN